jgi:hypothetical protein
MKAQEARKLAEAAQTGKLPEIYEAIKSAAEKGDYRAHVYFIVDPKDKATLEADGFKVTDVADPREICYEISWGPNPYIKEP